MGFILSLIADHNLKFAAIWIQKSIRIQAIMETRALNIIQQDRLIQALLRSKDASLEDWMMSTDECQYISEYGNVSKSDYIWEMSQLTMRLC